MVFGFFKKKPVAAAAPPAVGRWVENAVYVDYGYGREGWVGNGTYKWEGPEPPGGRPQNPAETPEAIARLARRAHDKAMIAESEKKDEALLKYRQKYPPSKDEEENKAACDKVIAELEAKRLAERAAYSASLYTPNADLIKADAEFRKKDAERFAAQNASQPYGGRSKKRTKKSKKAGRRHKRSTKRRHSS